MIKDTNHNINLCKLLKGHEGETFYSSICGNIKLRNIVEYDYYPIKCCALDNNTEYHFCRNGKFHPGNDAEVMLFPSKDQRDWNKWIEEQKPKIPKTWSEMVKNDSIKYMKVLTCNKYDDNGNLVDDCCTGQGTKIEKSALAFIKIHQLIEISYGGNITDEEWKDGNYKYGIYIYKGTIKTAEFINQKEHVTFHTNEQRKEFLSYPENISLIKDFYMIL